MEELRKRYQDKVGLDNLSEYKEFELPFIVDSFGGNYSKKVLDFGAGTSCLPAYLGVLGAEMWVLDNGSWHPEINERNYNKLYDSKVKYVVGELLNNPELLPDRYFDVIYSVSTLEHLMSPESAVEKLKEKLKDGGRHIHIVDIHPNITYLNYRLLARAIDGKKHEKEEFEFDDFNEDLYNPEPRISRIAISNL
jgi:2-polyprenyl-3-methyl-5-hydroxy-6-metoxy-1,4-benzoquinol methylase